MKVLPFLALLTILVPAVAAQSQYAEFVKEFDKAVEFSNDAGLRRAIENRSTQAIEHFEVMVQAGLRSADGAERYRKQVEKLREGFKAAFGTDTLEQIERYYARVKPERINQLVEVDQLRTKLYNEWLKMKEAQDRKGILELVDQGAKLGRRCEELGHKIKAADVYSTLASFHNTIPKHTAKDTSEAIAFAKMFMSQRDGWNWNKDRAYTQWKAWVKSKEVEVKVEKEKAEERKKAGLNDEAEGLSKFVDGKAPAITAKLEFKPLKAPIEGTSFVSGGVPVNWLSTRVTKDPAQMFYFKRKELFLVRSGATKLGVSLASTGTNPMKVEAGTKVKPSMIYLDAEKKQPYAFGFYVGGTTEPFASTITNSAPTKEAMTVYYHSLSSWVAKIGDTEVTFYDDNCDGKLMTPDPMDYGMRTRMFGSGPKKEVAVPVYDSIKVGKKGRIVPFSSAVQIGDVWYYLTLADGGQSVKAEPLHTKFFAMGTVTMKWSGSRTVKPRVLILRGRDSLATVSIDISTGKPVELPAGEYEIAYGRSSKGKGAQTQMAHITRGDSEVIKVTAGKTTVLKLGAPFKLDFVKGGDAANLEINSLYFRIKGAAGEVYGKIQGPTPAPEIVAAKSSSGRGAKVIGQFIPVDTPDVLNVAAETGGKMTTAVDARGMGVNIGFFPVVKGDKQASTVFKAKLPFPGALIGLRVKRHKMFGKILPIFK